MSRRDMYHNIVKEALIREGWEITHDPYNFDAAPKFSTDIGADIRLGFVPPEARRCTP